MSYTPNQSKYLTVAQVRTNNGQKDVKIILDVDTNIFYTLDDDNNFIPIAYSQSIDANAVSYDNNNSGLNALNVQEAIDDLGIYQYKSGYQQFLETAGTQSNVNTQVFAVNQLIAFPIIIRKPVTITTVQVPFVTGVSGNSVWGLYNSVNGLPNDLIFQTTAFDNNITGFQTYTLPTPINVDTGVYFVGYSTSSVPTIYGAANTRVAQVLNSLEGGSCALRLTANYTYNGTLPSTFGSPVTISYTIRFVPQVAFQIN